MNFRDLEYFLALVDHAHFGNAAKSCLVSQPALSIQIKKLEESLGVQLIERKNKSFIVTEIGKAIAEQARDIMQRIEGLRDTAKEAKNPYSGELSLGVIPTLGPYLLPHITPDLSKLFPKLTIYLAEEQTTKLITMIKEGKLDCALLALPLPLQDEDLITLPLFEEEFMLAVPKTDLLAKRKSIKPAELENKTLLLLEEGHCMREQALSLCYRAHASESRKFQATSLETLRYMVASNVGITLMPKLSCRPTNGLCYLPFSLHKPIRTIGLAWRSTSGKKPLFSDMINQIRISIGKKKLVKLMNTQILCVKN